MIATRESLHIMLLIYILIKELSVQDQRFRSGVKVQLYLSAKQLLWIVKLIVGGRQLFKLFT